MFLDDVKESIELAKTQRSNPSESIAVVISMILDRLSETAKRPVYDPNALFEDDFFYQMRDEIRNCIRTELEEFLKETGESERTLQSSVIDRLRYAEIFDHHFWNDCDPFWNNPYCGRYGATPGEDVIIKVFDYCTHK